jgi:hypothetical protein
LIYDRDHKIVETVEQIMVIKRSYRLNKRRQEITLKSIIQLVSSCLLPMMLGVFTGVITLQQQSASKQQRIEDRQVAREQREHDLN